MRSWLRNLFTSKRTALLEAEVSRLRETNLALEAELEQSRKETRAAVNTLLSQAGVTPLPPAEEVKTYPERMRRLTWQQKQRVYAERTRPEHPVAQAKES
jgi:hypothetical protein